MLYFNQKLFVRTWPQTLLSLLCGAFLLATLAGLWSFPLLERLEWLAYDMRVRSTLSYEKDPSVIIVDIDEKSLKEVGQWPWPRVQVAELIEKLFEKEKIQILGLDIVFAEAEGRTLALQWQNHVKRFPQLAHLPPPPPGEETLAAMFKKYPVVTGYYFQSVAAPSDPPPSGILPPAVGLEGTAQALQTVRFPAPQRYTANLPLLGQAAIAGGFFDNPGVDDDGVFRRVPLFQRWQNQWYPGLSFAMFHTALGKPPVQTEFGEGSGKLQLEAFNVGGFRIPVDGQGAVLVPFYGQRGHHTYISASDVLAGRVPQGRLKDAMVILGSSAPGLLDLRATPVNSVYPGVEINANILSGLLKQQFRERPPFMLAAELLALALIALFMSVVFPRVNMWVLILASGLLMGGWIAGNLFAWKQGWVLPLAPGVIFLGILTFLHFVGNFLRESLQKYEVTERFGEYVPPELVEKMAKNSEAYSIGGKEEELTVLFSDVRGFTSFSEGLSPEKLSEVMNRLLTPLTHAIHDHKGTIDKYMGDAVMAFWGAPIPDSHHARHAVEGAFAMQHALAEINAVFMKEGMKPLAMGIGINTGKMNVGNMGSDFRKAYTVLGDNVNLGSRVEGLTKPYHVSILVTESTAQAVSDWAFRRIDLVRVKGRSQPVWILEPLGRLDALSPESHEKWSQHEAALSAYQSREFKEARSLFEALAQKGDQTAQLYLERIAYYLVSPPEDNWDGAWTHTEK